MAPSLLLVRHGPSAHVHTGGSIDRAGVHAWLSAYDAAGIVEVAQPPAWAADLAQSATHLVASDLPRAIASAERLVPGREVRVSPLLRESPLVIPRWPTRLPLAAWAAVIHLGWTYDMIRGRHPSEAERARTRAAAAMLEGVVADGSTACVVTHGVFRRVLAMELTARGWSSTGRREGYRHWSCWSLVRSG